MMALLPAVVTIGGAGLVSLLLLVLFAGLVALVAYWLCGLFAPDPRAAGIVALIVFLAVLLIGLGT